MPSGSTKLMVGSDNPNQAFRLLTKKLVYLKKPSIPRLNTIEAISARRQMILLSRCASMMPEAV